MLNRNRRSQGTRHDERRVREFTRAYDENVWHVYGYVAYRTGSREDAEDLTQFTFERALRAWDEFDERRARPRTWLLSIARNLLVDHYRRNGLRRHESFDEEETGSAGLGYAELETRGFGVSPELAIALQRLSQRDREVIALRFGGDLTGPEIAELMELGLSNVQQILSRSLRALRAELEPQRSERGLGV